ncbi:MAG: hypothetical protein H7Z40_15980 [Phycisphaerae bacterium]|nr:hypothetical protein [Gemmatimonadaceae bacterium]
MANTLWNAARCTAVLAFVASAACDSSTESGSVTVAVAPTTITTTPGAPGVGTVNVTRSGSFTGDVALTAEGLPAGVTAAFQPSTLASGVTTTSMVLTAANTAVSGTTTVTVRASGTGVTARTTTVQVTVNAASVTLTAGTGTATTTQGAAATIALTLQRLGGFTGPVNLEVFGLPANVLANFVPSTLAAGVTTSTLTLSAASNAPVGTTNISIRASGAGIAEQIIPVQLVITTGTQPDFTLTATPAAVTVAPGGIVTSTINIGRVGGFIDNISFVTSTLPAGVVATITPNPANANTATLSFATTATATAGTFTITVTGTGGTIAPRTVNVMLTVGPQPGLTLALNPVTTSVAAGSSVQNTLTIARIGAFTGDVTFAAANLPAGMTVTFAPATVTGTATTTVATITAAATVVPSFYTINLQANAVGSLLSATVPLNITVNAAPSFRVSVSNSATPISAGTSGTQRANIIRGGGFTGPVNLSVSGLPDGISASVTPSTVTGDTATINLNIGATLPAGTYTGTLNGTATGFPAASSNFSVTVAPAIIGNIRWQFCSSSGIPVFVAIKDGVAGTWTRVAPNLGSLYAFDINEPIGSVFIVKRNGNGFATTIYMQTESELQAIAAAECSTTPTGTKSLTGSVSALDPTQLATITMGGGLGTANFASLNYTLNNVLTGPQDLVAIRNVVSVAGLTTDKLLIRRNLNLTSGSVIAPIDFGSAEAFDPLTTTVLLGNLGSDEATLATTFRTQNGGQVLLSASPASTALSRTVIGVPTANLVSTDLHFFTAIATSADLSSVRTVFSYSSTLTGANVTFGAPLATPTITSSTNFVSLPRVQGAFQPDYPTGISASFTQNATTPQSVTFTASRGFFNNVNYNLEYPDLTAIPEFDPAWGLSSSTATDFAITGTNATAVAIGNGTNFRTATRRGTIVTATLRR